MNEEVRDLRNEIRVEALAGGGSFELQAFATIFGRRLEEAEALADLNVELLQCNGPRGRRLELLGYAENPLEQSLTILAGRYYGIDQTLTMTDARDISSRATGFIKAAADGWLLQNLEMSSREWEYAEYFSKQIEAGRIVRIRVVIITDGVMSDRIRTIDSDTVIGLKVSYEVWDQKRIVDAALPDLGSEDIHIDFTKWMPNGLPCLVASGDDVATQTYLAVIPAKVLSDIFDDYGSLLLESNVRTYLSARGQVNRGIQNTLTHEPERFLAYNNGLTTTASEVNLSFVNGASSILSLDRWQIVNGGQTTASIAHFLRNNRGRDVNGVSIQMKLVTVTDADSSSVVQAVAKYANSQNRVTVADLFSTHEFHIRMEQISRRLKAPAKEGQQYQTGWYYERARGQWENDRSARGSASEQAKFEMEYPKQQRITKTDLAKYDYCWGQRPDLVSKGAQSAFADYAAKIDAQWSKSGGKGADVYGDKFFCDSVAKAIMYDQLRVAVRRSEWYRASPGYLANIVAYAISRFAYQLQIQYKDATFDFAKVWERQEIGDAALSSLLEIAYLAQRHLTDVNRPQANVTQWAKQQACWERFKEVRVHLDPFVEKDTISTDRARVRETNDRRQRAMDTGFEAVGRVLEVRPDVWAAVAESVNHIAVSPSEKDLIRLFGLQQGKVPSERQAVKLLKLLQRMTDNGVLAEGAF